MIIFTDSVIENIKEHIASHDPERGGALLGAPHTNIVSEFIYDENAITSSASYTPSKGLTDIIRKSENRNGLVYKGIIHSHPNGFNQPSSQDLTIFEQNLSQNPHMPYFVAPIVTRGGDTGKNNDMDLGDDMFLTLFCAHRKAGYNGISIKKPDISVCHAKRDIENFISTLDNHVHSTDGYFELNGINHLNTTIKDEKTTIEIIFPINYPLTAPLVLQGRNGMTDILKMKSVTLEWDFATINETKLAKSLNTAL